MPDAEEQIRRAIEEGKFDNLPGKGQAPSPGSKPIRGPGMAAGESCAKNQRVLPALDRKTQRDRGADPISACISETCPRMAQAGFQDGLPASSIKQSGPEALEKFKNRLAEINRLHPTYNLRRQQRNCKCHNSPSTANWN